MSPKNKIILFIFLLGFVPLAFADTLYLKTGDQLEGKVVEESKEKITFQFEGGRIDFARDEIQKIEKADWQTDEPVKKVNKQARPTSKAEKRPAPRWAPAARRSASPQPLSFEEFIPDLLASFKMGFLSLLLYLLYPVAAGFFLKYWVQLNGGQLSYLRSFVIPLLIFWTAYVFNVLFNFILPLQATVAAVKSGTFDPSRPTSVSSVQTMTIFIKGVGILLGGGIYFLFSRFSLKLKPIPAVGLAGVLWLLVYGITFVVGLIPAKGS